MRSADFHWPDLDLIVFAHDSHLVTTLQLCHRALGNEQSAFPGLGNGPNSGELAGTKDISRIREPSLKP